MIILFSYLYIDSADEFEIKHPILNNYLVIETMSHHYDQRDKPWVSSVYINIPS